MKNQREDSNDTICCVTVGNPWEIKQYHWKSEANEDHLPSNRQRI